VVSARGESSISAASRSAVLQTGAATVEAGSAWVVGLERARRPRFHRGRAACGADQGQNVSSRFFSKCGYQLFRFWSDHGMRSPVRDRASQVHRCVRRRGRRRRHHHCPTTDAGTTSYGNAFAERWIGPGRECLSPHHMIGFSAPPQVMTVVTVNSTSASARTDDRRNHASPGLVTSRSTESTAPVHGRIGSLRRAARVSPFCFAGGSMDRAGASAIESAIAARLTEPCCDCVVGQPGMPAYVADLHPWCLLVRILATELRTASS
jgi:hypothetical protein